MQEFCVIDYARGGRAVSTHPTRAEAMEAAERMRDPKDPKRYRAERFFPGETEVLCA